MPDPQAPLRAAPPSPGEVTVRVSKRARRIRLKVAPGRPLEVVVPPRTSPAQIERMLEANREWIARKSAWAAGVESRSRDLGLDRPGTVWLDGLPHPLPTVRGRPPTDGQALLRWYRREARDRLTDDTERIAAELRAAGLLNRAPGRISIRDPRTRWGSCSASGNLSFSWRLVMLAPEIRHYVVTHELCHLVHHDHSAHFWSLLSRALPDWRARAEWLKRHGLEVSRHRPTPA